MARGAVVIGGALALSSAALQVQAQALPPSEPEHFAISVHARSTGASARAEQAAWLSLTLPLDRLAAPRPALRAAATAPKAEAAAPETSPGEPAPGASST